MIIQVTPDSRIAWPGHDARCVLGRGGVRADKIEGDGATPVGTFPLRRLFFRPDRLSRPDTRLPITVLSPAFGWCDDPESRAYNRLIRLPAAARHEKLWRDDHIYDLIIEVGYNDAPPVPGLGSAIFMHLTREDHSPTEGCVALDAPDLLVLLRSAGTGDHLKIDATDGP